MVKWGKRILDDSFDSRTSCSRLLLFVNLFQARLTYSFLLYKQVGIMVSVMRIMHRL